MADESTSLTPAQRRYGELLGLRARSLAHRRYRDPWTRDAPNVQAQSWPAHAPAVNSFDLDKLLSIAPEDPNVALAARFLRDPSLHVARPDTARCPVSRIREATANTLEARGFACPVAKDDVLSWGIASEVPQAAKQRQRVVHDMLPGNALDVDAPEVALRALEPLRTLASRSTWMATFDFRCWYYQLRTGDAVSYSMCFRLARRWLRFLVGPMGHKNMVFVAHTITAFLAKEALRRCGTHTNDVTEDVIIDNVAFFSHDLATLTQVCDAFIALCAETSATIGDYTPPATHGIHRGMVFDLAAGSVSLKPSWMAEFRARVGSAHAPVPFQALESLAGSVAWIFAVLTESAHPLPFYLFREVARYCGRPMTLVAVWRCALDELDALVASIEACPASPLAPTRLSGTFHLITDACKSGPFSGWGAIAVIGGRIFTTSAVFPTNTSAHIGELEMRAVALGTHFALALNSQGAHNMQILCDNKTCCHVLKKGRSSSRPLHTIARHILQLARSSALRIDVTWIPSQMNPADGLSRGRNFTARDVDLARSLVSMDWVVSEAPGDQSDTLGGHAGCQTLWPSHSFPLLAAPA